MKMFYTITLLQKTSHLLAELPKNIVIATWKAGYSFNLIYLAAVRVLFRIYLVSDQMEQKLF